MSFKGIVSITRCHTGRQPIPEPRGEKGKLAQSPTVFLVLGISSVGDEEAVEHRVLACLGQCSRSAKYEMLHLKTRL